MLTIASVITVLAVATVTMMIIFARRLCPVHRAQECEAEKLRRASLGRAA